jgi:hypothetical protein
MNPATEKTIPVFNEPSEIKWGPNHSQLVDEMIVQLKQFEKWLEKLRFVLLGNVLKAMMNESAENTRRPSRRTLRVQWLVDIDDAPARVEHLADPTRAGPRNPCDENRSWLAGRSLHVRSVLVHDLCARRQLSYPEGSLDDRLRSGARGRARLPPANCRVPED